MQGPIGTDKHASYLEAFANSVKEKVLPFDCKLRRVKYLNNVIEQDHRFIRRRWRAMQCFRSFHTAERTLEGIESMHMIRKGKVKRLNGTDAIGRRNLSKASFRSLPNENSRTTSLASTYFLQHI